MAATVRLRLFFEDERILTDRQKAEGLGRCWLLLPSDLATVSDLTSHLIRSFSLQSSCPDGLLLSMDDFALPPFESTSFFNDRDVVRVWKKDVIRRDAIMAGENTILTEDVAEKQPVLCDKPLAIRDSGGEPMGDLLDIEEDTGEESEDPKSDYLKNSSSKVLRKKRKRFDLKKQKEVSMKSCHLSGPFHITKCRRKRMKLKSTGNNIIPVDDLANVSVERRADDQLDIENLKESSTDEHVGRDEDTQCKSLDSQGEPQANGELKKFPSRSARRKKAKRKWRREHATSEKSKHVFEHCLSETSIHDTVTKGKALIGNEKAKDLVPKVVKAGHIRFEHSDDDEQILHEEVQATIQWNGTLNKKKGQKWGKEKTFSCEKMEESVTNNVYFGKDNSELKVASVNPVDFEKLCPLVGLPKVGDVVAYRLVELTSSRCPEISNFRVGKVSFFDPKTLNSILLPVPGYPILAGALEDLDMQSANSLYKEDNSLEIEFTSLIDVRLFKDVTSGTVIAIPGRVESNVTVPAKNGDTASGYGDLNTESQPSTSGKEMVVWDEISEVLERKKAELLQNNKASCKKEISVEKDTANTKSSWSYRALRGSALGPTISLLRANNQL